ncbi:MAG: AAA family ATPase [Candidatus Pacebacteria bacterium]|nr:AAA family ATPase [Candidatus Paceibacterota bacterium]MBP9832123.1 AAA family ATPase [Candidatus Paceibacterota bacterium]
MHLTRLDIAGFKSFAKKTSFDFNTSVVAIVGPNGSGKSNVAEAVRFVLGEQSMKSMRGKRGEDLIWNGSATTPRANRASVAITFDNASRFLNLDFDEVVIERIVHRDGVNEYRLNGSQVRLKDILELLAGANIGATGHHIISQGEADKILSAPPKERREMLEDALGLKAYQYKLEESSRKLEKTEENMRQVEALRREIAPHLRFLKKQVEKVEKAEVLRASAVVRFQAYFKREEAYLKTAGGGFESELLEKRKELADIASKVAEAKQALAHSEEDKRGGAILEISGALDDARSKRADALRKASRLEGQIEAMERTMSNASIPLGEVSRLVEEGERALSGFSNTPIQEVLSFFREYFSRFKALTAQTAEDSNDVAFLKRERELAVNTEKECIQRETELGESLEKIRAELDSARTNEREKERALFSLATAEREVRHRINILEGEIGRLGLEKAEFERDLLEAGTLIGREVLLYPDADVSLLASRDEQVEEKRQLEKTKIRLEEIGTGASADVLKEHKEVSEREAFLEHELADLGTASVSLKGLIQNLEAELSVRFKEGIDAINSEFTKLFALMFDGGSASLVRVEEPVRRKVESGLDGGAAEETSEETEETSSGIDISLSIPRKRVKSLVMLSGGERTLTSIALIFAMSSVNPPPFLMLDETDAALDESNSRRYGDMVEALSKKSQLAIITHNRETMSRAGILYGITMGNDGVSKVLSVKLEEAVKVAK